MMAILFNLAEQGLVSCDFGSAILRLQLVRRLVRHLAQAGFGAVLADYVFSHLGTWTRTAFLGSRVCACALIQDVTGRTTGGFPVTASLTPQSVRVL